MTRLAARVGVFTTETKSLLVPPLYRGLGQLAGMPEIYDVTRPDYDRLPLLTFLIDTIRGTAGRVPASVIRIVQPNDPRYYPEKKLTEGRRLLYGCWSGGKAVKLLITPKRMTYRHVVLPGEPGFDEIDKFKIACDHVRAGNALPVPMPDTLLRRALGIET